MKNVTIDSIPFGGLGVSFVTNCLYYSAFHILFLDIENSFDDPERIPWPKDSSLTVIFYYIFNNIYSRLVLHSTDEKVLGE